MKNKKPDKVKLENFSDSKDEFEKMKIKKIIKATIFEIGFVNDTACNSMTTMEQINEVQKLECDLELSDGTKLSWDYFNDPAEPRSLFQAIIHDRKGRVDKKILMANRPPFAVVTAFDKRAVRLEFYEGHDSLTCTHDLRAKELHKSCLPVYMDSDPNAYDPVKFLQETFGIPAEFSKKLLDSAHDLTQ